MLTSGALDRCDDPAEWLRREIETALDAKRNMVALLPNGFTFEALSTVGRLQSSPAPLRRHQALRISEDDFFDAATEQLRSKYIAVTVNAVPRPTSAHAQQVVQEQLDAASKAADLAPAGEEAALQSTVLVLRRLTRGQCPAAPKDGPIDLAAQSALGDDHYCA